MYRVINRGLKSLLFHCLLSLQNSIKHRMKKFGTLKDSINRRMGTSQIQEIQRKKGKRDDFC